MNSKITPNTYQEIISHDYIKKSRFFLRNFYISGKKGEAIFSKNSEKASKKFCFTWLSHKKDTYRHKCQNYNNNNNMYNINFSEFDELIEELDNKYFCQYHAYCFERCSIERITSPKEQCAICLKEVQIHMLEETECEHRFCLSCLDTYVKSRIIHGICIPCPVCRRDLQYCDVCENAKYNCTCL